MRCRLAGVGDRQPRRPHIAARLAEHLHQRLELALVGAEVPAPAAGEPELREEARRCAGHARCAASTSPRQTASQNSASGAPQSEPPPMNPSPPCSSRNSRPATLMNGPKTRTLLDDALRRLEELVEVRRAVLERDDVVDVREPLGELGRRCRRSCRAASCRRAIGASTPSRDVLVVARPSRRDTSSSTAAASTRCRRHRPRSRAGRARPPPSPCSDGAPDRRRDAACDLIDRRLGDEPALLRRLREPFAGRAVDQDAVHPYSEVESSRARSASGSRLPSCGERGRARGPVAAARRRRRGPCVVLLRSSRVRSGRRGRAEYSGGMRVAARSTSCSASRRAIRGPSVKPVVAISMW